MAPCRCGCGRVLVTPRVRQGRVQQFFSLACYGRWRETHDPAWVDARRRGAVATGRKNRAKAAAAIAPKVAGLTPVEAYRLGHHEGYPRGWKRGLRIGLARGFDLAGTP